MVLEVGGVQMAFWDAKLTAALSRANRRAAATYTYNYTLLLHLPTTQHCQSLPMLSTLAPPNTRRV
jgi:hypothetical protein